ncbi:MAG: hypothetical protein WCV63_01145 [Negativicutes bacterium]|jgi:hypothetical protein
MKKLAVVLILVLVAFSATCFADVSWDDDVVSADGYGVPPQNTVNPAQANILARRAAVVDGQRNLMEQIMGVSLDATTTVRDAMVTSDVIKTNVVGFLKGFKVVKGNMTAEGVYHVVLQVRLYGADSLASAVIPASGIGGGQQPQAIPLPQSNVSTGTVTGLVVDCRGLKLERTMTPVIYDENGRVIYSSRYISTDLLIANGMCDYDTADEMRSLSFRAGAKQLMIKPVRLRDFNRNAVVSVRDGDIILAANQKNDMLKKTQVVFLTDN